MLAMNAAASLLGAIDGVAPIELVEQRGERVLVAGDRVAVVQGQPGALAWFDRRRDRRGCAWLPDGGRRGLPRLVRCMVGAPACFEEVQRSLLHHLCLFSEQGTGHPHTLRFESRADL